MLLMLLAAVLSKRKTGEMPGHLPGSKGRIRMDKRTKEQGSLIIEATFVFPVMFFVLLFLIYMGNMFYMRSRVDAVVGNAAIEGAAMRADPLLYDMESAGTLTMPSKISSIKPYYIFSDHNQVKNKIEDDVRTKLSKLGDGFFAGMGVSQVDVKATYHYSLIDPSYTVDATYSIKFPLKFLMDDDPVILTMESSYTVPVTNTPELIQTVDMIQDYSDNTGLTKKISEGIDKIKSFMSGN
jgi:hypothetical protein